MSFKYTAAQTCNNYNHCSDEGWHENLLGRWHQKQRVFLSQCTTTVHNTVLNSSDMWYSSLLSSRQLSQLRWRLHCVSNVRCPVWKTKIWYKSKPTRKLKHANSILGYFEYFCQMSSKLILTILSYTVSKFAHFFLRHSVLEGGTFKQKKVCTNLNSKKNMFATTKLLQYGNMMQLLLDVCITIPWVTRLSHDTNHNVIIMIIQLWINYHLQTVYQSITVSSVKKSINTVIHENIKRQ